MFRLTFCLVLAAASQVSGQLIQFPGSGFTVPMGINNNGTIAGFYTINQGSAHGFIFNGTSYMSFDVPGAINTTPQAINDSGTISGFYQDGAGNHGFLRAPNGAITTYDFPTVGSNTMGMDINTAGTVVLSSNAGAFLRNGSTVVSAFSHSFANVKMGLNDSLTVVDTVVTGQNTATCFIDSGSNSTSFSVFGALSTQCFDVNNAGSIAGTYRTASGQFAFVRVGSAVSTLPLPGTMNASANGLNDVGQVVGSYSLSNGQTLGFVTNYVLNPTNVRGDFDGNGVPDVVLQFPDGSAGIWYLSAAGRQLSISSFAFFAGPSSGFSVVDVGDLNRDGVPDVILRFADGSMGVWYMGGPQGATITGFAYISGPIQGWMPVGVADLNGDGHPDLIIQNTDGSTGVWYLGGAQGNQIQGFGIIGGPLPLWKVVGVADLDRDGHPDVILQQPDGTVGVWYLIGPQGTAISSFSLIASPSTWSVVGVNDMDGDGQPDLIIRNIDGTLAVWYLGGTQGAQITAFTPITIPGHPEWHELVAH